MKETLSGYRIFYMTARTQSISRAAEKLYISQPAISKAIQKLEGALGVRLFLRSSRGVTLTPEGEVLYRQVEKAFSAIEAGEEEVTRDKRLGLGRIRIGVSNSLCKYFLLPILKDFLKEYPHVQIRIRTQSTGGTLALLDRDIVDLGLIGGTGTEKGLKVEAAGKLEDCFAASPAYLESLKERGIGKGDYLKKGTLLLLDPENRTRQYIDESLRKKGIRAEDLLLVSDMDLIIAFARTGIGIGAVIRSFVKEDLQKGSLVEVPLPGGIPPREAEFVYREGSLQNKALKDFLAFFRGEEKRREGGK